MTGFKSKKTAALDEEGMYLVHQTAQPIQLEQCNYPDCKCPTENPCLKGLAQPEQEPVIVSADSDADEMNRQYGDRYGFDWKYPDKTPQQPESETNHEMPTLNEATCNGSLHAAIAKAPAAQEPVAIVAVDVGGQIQVGWIKKPQHNDKLYTTPPQRPWVEPRGDEWFNWWRVSKIADETEAEIDFVDFITIALAVSAKLKEKNNG
jgi:hypothetical protein